MHHTGRRFRILRVNTSDELLALASEQRLPLCTALALEEFLFICDEDRLPQAEAEWVVVRDGSQVDRVVLGEHARLARMWYLRVLLRKPWQGRLFSHLPLDLRFDHPEGGCELCAENRS